jgi:hypothetical protein
VIWESFLGKSRGIGGTGFAGKRFLPRKKFKHLILFRGSGIAPLGQFESKTHSPCGVLGNFPEKPLGKCLGSVKKLGVVPKEKRLDSGGCLVARGGAIDELGKIKDIKERVA